jgi:hypothetical protein
MIDLKPGGRLDRALSVATGVLWAAYAVVLADALIRLGRAL